MVRASRAAGLWFTLFAASLLGAQQPQSGNTLAQPTADQIVRQLVAHNQERAERLRSYRSIRSYRLEYTGFPHSARASMTVEAIYQAPATRIFHVLSQSGSKLIVDLVLNRLLKTEEEAARHPQENALTPANYNFTLIGVEPVAGHNDYVLQVEPKKPRKLLYRGKIWVNAAGYAVEKIEAQPAQNPSFWIIETNIHHVYAERDGFWLPQKDESISKLRLGGRAVLTIDYGDYQLQDENTRSAADSTRP